MNKKVLFSFIAIAICFISIFSFSNFLTCFASTSQTYTYSGEVSSDSSNFSNYAIDSVESLNVRGTFVHKVSFTIATRGTDLTFKFLADSSGSTTATGNYLFYNTPYNSSFQIDMNFAIRCTSSTNGITFKYHATSVGKISGVTYYYRDIILSKGNSFELYYSTISFGGTYSDMIFGGLSDYNRFSTKVYDNSSYDLSAFVDMDSETNFNLQDINFDSFISSNSFCLSNYFDKFPLGNGGRLTDEFISFSASLSDLGSFVKSDNLDNNGGLYKDSSHVNNVSSLCYLSSVNSGSYESSIGPNSIGLYFDNFYFSIYRPVYRTNNTLIIYNFDYNNFLSNCNGATYELMKDYNYYDVVYSGSLPNSYFIYVSSEEVNNIIFDEYIYFYLSFNGVRFLDNAIYLGEDIFLGFDFNFTYYNQPLVASNGSFNYTFNKPKYVEAHFSLAPFYIPVLELIENAFIFLMFYCPITSDLLRFVHLDEFFGSLFNLFNFSNSSITLIGINLGSFIWSVIAFIIFFRLLQSFMPIVWGSAKKSYSDYTYSVKKADLEKQKQRIAHHKEISRQHEQNLKNKKR